MVRDREHVGRSAYGVAQRWWCQRWREAASAVTPTSTSRALATSSESAAEPVKASGWWPRRAGAAVAGGPAVAAGPPVGAAAGRSPPGTARGRARAGGGAATAVERTAAAYSTHNISVQTRPTKTTIG
jgi:hypothetical protein